MEVKLNNYGWYILPALSLIPIILWLLEIPISLRFSNISSILMSLGQAAGLSGMAMFSLVIILSTRLRFFEKFFKGINESYTVHHFFGGLAFCLLLSHPLLLSYNFVMVSFKDAASFLLPGSNWPQNFGIIGLSVMIITLFITFYTKLKYQIWKFTHKFMGLAYAFAFLHVFFIGADVAANQLLKIYLFILAIAAIVAYLYRAIFSSFFVKTFDYMVKEAKLFEDKIWEIEFAPNSEAKTKNIKFTAGQFVFLKIYSKNLSKEMHPFSMSSAPDEPFKLAIKELGDYTNKIGSLKVGDRAVIEGPFGIFDFKKCQNKKQVWAAGGIGIAPFLSMLRSLTDKDFDYKIDLYYSVKDENCLAFKDEIEQIAQMHKNLNATFWITDKHGFISAESMGKNTPDLSERDVLVCGPKTMMSAIKSQLLKYGLSKNQIYMEEFQLY